MIDLDAIQARADAASPAPWWTSPDYSNTGINYGHGNNRQQIGKMHGTGDAAFVIAARADVPALVAELRAAREVYAELGPILEPLRVMHGRHLGTDHLPCGWCRLISAYDKAMGASDGHKDAAVW